jgi:hypothetical protein
MFSTAGLEVARRNALTGLRSGRMLISAREAALVLEPAGVTRRQARTLLGRGFAGTPRVTPSATLFDEARRRRPGGMARR